ncbi:M3 family metallopeptidase [Cellulomonas sp. HZM]|uniref:M3 family metallopeptidase n=1 Tax=Cellulomonas sp. HZM TaxID=1454010 RepID=UPI000493322C|nr:M3 family metallopeptidase [Cellulomonas sp. HZM]
MAPSAFPTAFPTDAAGWLPYLAEAVDGGLARTRELLDRLKDGTERSTDDVLALWNDAAVVHGGASALAHLLSEVHPDADVRAAAEEGAQASEDLATERSLDVDLRRVLDGTSADGLDSKAARVREHALRDFRRAGVDRSDEEREELRELARRCTELGLEFSRAIREGTRSIRVEAARLAGLPEDFVEAHPADEDGLVTLTTEYPDLVPVRTYATDAGVRRELMTEYLRLAWPENEAVLAELLRLRARRAELLGYPDWPTYEVETRMIGSGAAVAEFIERLDALTAEPAAADVQVLLERARQDDPTLEAITPADSLFYDAAIRRERFDVDPQALRPYFRWEAVKEGVLSTMCRLFGLALRPVQVQTWHEDVDVYDVVDDGTVIGRVYLDMHPRAGKYNHAAQFPLVPGIAGRQLPEGVLVCNFPTGLMEHDDVLTFFHEIGHLLHEIVGGGQAWAEQTGVATEWDFVEAPSQLLEEWGWDVGVLQGFATNETGEPIPADLVERMRTADAFGRGAWTRRQLNFTALSYGLHANPPADLDAFTAQVDEHYGPFAPIPGTHQYAGFGHLDGYGSAYYTYLWSLVIAKDLRTAFGDDLMDPEVGRRYRECILEPGGSADAAELVERFLGRPSSFDAFDAWLAASPR